MTGAEPDAPTRRDATEDDLAGLRLYYRLAGDPTDHAVDWFNDRGPTIAEAMAVKTATVSKVSLSRIMAVLQRSSAADEDPEALQALVWMLRRRAGDTAPITALAALDMLSIRQEYLDAQGVELDLRDPEPSEQERQLASAIAADLMRHLPTLDLAAALAAAASLIVAAPPAEETPGEDPAGDEPAEPVKPAPARRAARKRTTPKTSKASPAGGSPN